MKRNDEVCDKVFGEMRPTHQLRDHPHLDVTAWQYDRKSPVPVWVARRFHNLGDVGLTAVGRGGTVVHVDEGDWIVTDGSVAIVLKSEEFSTIFHALAQAAGQPEEVLPNAS